MELITEIDLIADANFDKSLNLTVKRKLSNVIADDDVKRDTQSYIQQVAFEIQICLYSILFVCYARMTQQPQFGC